MKVRIKGPKAVVRHMLPPPVFRLGFTLMHPANRGHRLSAVGRAARFEVGTRLLRRPMVVPLGERSKIIVYPGETNAPHAVYTNPPNWREMSVWKRHLRPGDLFVDVGANIGIYTIFAQDLGAATIAFEPNRRNFDRLEENMALNAYSGELHNKAAADVPGVLRMTDELDSYNHLILRGEAGGIEVETVTLDSVIGDRDVAGLKLDVEGAERLVLLGAGRALAERRIPLIQCEWSAGAVSRTLGEGREPVERLLRDFGYQYFYRPDRHGRPRLLEGSIPVGRDVFASLRPLES